MYVITMKVTKQYAQGEYAFNTRKACKEFLEGLNDYEIETIIAIDKLSRGKSNSAWYEFFNR